MADLQLFIYQMLCYAVTDIHAVSVKQTHESDTQAAEEEWEAGERRGGKESGRKKRRK